MCTFRFKAAPKRWTTSHGAAAAIRHTATPGLTTQPAEHGAEIDRDHGPAERVVPRQQVTQTRRQGQDPLHPTAHSPRGGEPGAPATTVIWKELACSPCVSVFNHRLSPCRNNVCMQEITVADVYAAVEAALPRGAAGTLTLV